MNSNKEPILTVIILVGLLRWGQTAAVIWLLLLHLTSVFALVSCNPPAPPPLTCREALEAYDSQGCAWKFTGSGKNVPLLQAEVICRQIKERADKAGGWCAGAFQGWLNCLAEVHGDCLVCFPLYHAFRNCNS